MTEQEARTIRVNEVLINNNSNHSRFAIVASGFRVQAVLPNGLQVRRIHYIYLTNNPVESWTLRWDQLLNFSTLPFNSQLPLL